MPTSGSALSSTVYNYRCDNQHGGKVVPNSTGTEPGLLINSVNNSTNSSTSSSSILPTIYEPSLPFIDEESCTLGHVQPATPLLRTSTLKDLQVQLPGDQLFVDKVLPQIANKFSVNKKYPSEFFVALHHLVYSQQGIL